jgi:hypothetical protein
MLEAIGFEAFAERARRELRNAGEAVANRTVQAPQLRPGPGQR